MSEASKSAQHTPGPTVVHKVVKLEEGEYTYRGVRIWAPDFPANTRWPWMIGPRRGGFDFRTLADACRHVDLAFAAREQAEVDFAKATGAAS